LILPYELKMLNFQGKFQSREGEAFGAEELRRFGAEELRRVEAQ